jgi:DNA-damage-inducible protein D
MNPDLTNTNETIFVQIKQTDENGNEFWYSRQLAKVLEYTNFRNFTGVIKKAKQACINSEQEISEHLVEANEVLEAGQGAKHTYPSFKFSRYFCYLIIQNADPS